MEAVIAMWRHHVLMTYSYHVETRETWLQSAINWIGSVETYTYGIYILK